ncbi:MAG: hypothetical protein ABSE06_18035 [Anaerolineaceae bacterium]|jgi:hypothetical protein
MSLFGLSLIGLRSFAVLAEGLVMLLASLIIRDLGSSRWAQILGTEPRRGPFTRIIKGKPRSLDARFFSPLV